uniref:Uncharacterized protein n=1 Tax=Romanomermis culicivorax TaxID=13658 RepID=A0A915JNK9_ROMCU
MNSGAILEEGSCKNTLRLVFFANRINKFSNEDVLVNPCTKRPKEKHWLEIQFGTIKLENYTDLVISLWP